MAEAEKKDERRIVSEKWYLGETLGKGGYGFVKCGYHIKNNKPFALKFMRKSEKNEEKWGREQAAMVATEINALKSVDSPYVLKLFAYNLRCSYPNKDGTSFDTVLLVLELAPGGELFDILYYNGPLEAKISRTYFYQLCAGLKAIHATNICHRDLKPQNLLLNKRFQLKITDFGLAKIFKDDTTAKQKIMETSYVGTKGYQAPEILLKRKYTTKCDVFSCGVILFILLTGYPPFEEATGSDGWYRKICQKKFKDFWDKHRDCGVSTDEGKDLIQKCIAYQPMERYKVDEMLEHDWIMQEKLDSKELESTMRKLHAKAAKKKANDARKQQQLQTSVTARAMESPIPVYDPAPLAAHRIHALKLQKDHDFELLMPSIEAGIGDCQGKFKREDDWHVKGHVTRNRDKKKFQVEAKVFKIKPDKLDKEEKVVEYARAFMYLYVENDQDLRDKMPVLKKAKNEEEAEEVKSKSVSEITQDAIWKRVIGFVDEEYVDESSSYDDVSYDDFEADDFKFEIGYNVEH